MFFIKSIYKTPFYFTVKMKALKKMPFIAIAAQSRPFKSPNIPLSSDNQKQPATITPPETPLATAQKSMRYSAQALPKNQLPLKERTTPNNHPSTNVESIYKGAIVFSEHNRALNSTMYISHTHVVTYVKPKASEPPINRFP
jgi:hypothetical protein